MAALAALTRSPRHHHVVNRIDDRPRVAGPYAMTRLERDGAGDSFGPHHLEAHCFEQRPLLVGGGEQIRILRTAVTIGDILAVVPDDDQRAAGRYCGRATAQEQLAFARRPMQIDVGDQIPDLVTERPGGEVGDDPVEIEADRLRAGAPAGHADCREVDSGDLPPALREPNRVTTLAARKIDRATRGDVEFAHQFGEEPVRFDAPHLSLGVTGIPLNGIHTEDRRAVPAEGSTDESIDGATRGRR